MLISRPAFLILTCALFLGLTAFGQAARAADGQTWLAVLTGEVKAVSENQLRVAVSPRGLAFTDRPHRQARFIGSHNFVAAMWGETGPFQTDPPNASISDDTQDKVSIVTLSSAVMKDGLLDLRVTLLEGELPGQGDYVAITIDAIRDLSRAQYP